VEEAHITVQENQYLYQEDDSYVFMNTETFEQRSITGKLLGNKKAFLKEGMLVSLLMMGDTPIDITIPTFVELEVVESSFTTKSATITPQDITAVLETGSSINVPPFIKKGDIIKVDTRTGAYVERIGTKK
jgi:elongation factor P